MRVLPQAILGYFQRLRCAIHPALFAACRSPMPSRAFQPLPCIPNMFLARSAAPPAPARSYSTSAGASSEYVHLGSAPLRSTLRLRPGLPVLKLVTTMEIGAAALAL